MEPPKSSTRSELPEPPEPLERIALAEYTWTELKATIDDGRTTVVVPIGATEQHGSHLPLETDTRLGNELARRLAAELETALVGPAIPFGPSEEHAAFPGTVSISSETLQDLLVDYVGSLARGGFERVVLLPSHGGNFASVAAIHPELARSVEADVIAIDDLGRYMDLLNEGLERAGLDYREPVVHAGAVETAMVLAIDPDAVRDDIPDGYEGDVSASVLFEEGIEAYSKDGVFGDPHRATAEIGETILEHVVDAYADFVQKEFGALDSSYSSH